MDIRKKLFEMGEETYGDFSAKLNPNIPRDKFIGVRAGYIKELIKELDSYKKYKNSFLKELPHKYIEEYLLHIYIINKEKNFSEFIKMINEILPYIDNWMTCDAIRPVAIKNNLKEAEIYIRKWVDSKEVYISRFGIEMLMTYYLDNKFESKYLEWVSNSRLDDYYHKMMVAWYFATALAKQYDASLPYIREKKLGKWTHNKVIQKARESRRISDNIKGKLNELKWK